MFFPPGEKWGEIIPGVALVERPRVHSLKQNLKEIKDTQDPLLGPQ